MSNVRVRFAPSPTGPLHIGGVRTALFNYLFAKKHNGTFVLRIEDTDQNRYVANAEQYIMDSLEWCGIAPDETVGINEKFGPYRQSERKEIYKKYAQQLIDDGKAYYAFDSPEALDAERKGHEENGKTFIYNWHNREKGRLVNSLVLSVEEVQIRIENGDKYVVRFKTPTNVSLEMNDIIRGKITIDTNTLDDKILFKSDGMPTYHLANIVDDHLMEISHVIRGEEWLPSMALHVLLYQAFEWKAPEFAHLPLILKPTGKGKLSKRDGDKLGFPVFPLAYTNEATNEVSRGYKEDGYFSETVINFLAFLGWNPGTEQELFSLEELIADFDLARVNKSGARFDPDKTKWYNQQYLQQKPNEELAELFKAVIEKNVTSSAVERSQNKLIEIVGLIKERATFVSDFWDLSKFFFQAPMEYDAKASKKQWKEATPQIMSDLIKVLSEIEDFTATNLETIVKGWITSSELGFGKVMPPFRLSLVGAMSGPDLFKIAELLGQKETVSRIENAIVKL
ncbi:glutamate--tRNA ligase [Urechidicola vernalis]|uniref:Glutamate--tRNA ligase n=1 Tax=Urechidicola vernalis TaxID=3075600 RepID=A0ABU2Y7E2_9FLAO|nr:glutamate--tRNA ligase [Urechidicola sp. P050]MDT0553622.1 glutamate--tRNA ligase [Urechidicola sp. P050]